MVLVNFYSKMPSAAQVASDLRARELAVFNHMPTGLRDFEGEVEALVGHEIILLHENTVLKWGGADYVVMAIDKFDREKLRTIALDWVTGDCPSQVKYI